MTPQGHPQARPAPLRVRRILWGAFVASQLIFLLLIRTTPAKPVPESAKLVPIFAMMAAGMVAGSFAMKQMVMKRTPNLPQTGDVLAYAFCESASIFGLLIYFVAASSICYWLIGLGLLGILLHYPADVQPK